MGFFSRKTDEEKQAELDEELAEQEALEQKYLEQEEKRARIQETQEKIKAMRQARSARTPIGKIRTQVVKDVKSISQAIKNSGQKKSSKKPKKSVMSAVFGEQPKSKKPSVTELFGGAGNGNVGRRTDSLFASEFGSKTKQAGARTDSLFASEFGTNKKKKQRGFVY